MGAAGHRQVRSEGVTAPRGTPLTCGNARDQRLYWRVRSVRIEGVRGSNPLSSTEFFQVRWPVVALGFDADDKRVRKKVSVSPLRPAAPLTLAISWFLLGSSAFSGSRLVGRG